MIGHIGFRGLLASVLLLLGPSFAAAQGMPEDYERSAALEERYEGLVVNVVDNVRWIDGSERFTFRRSVEGGHRFFVMSPETLQERQAFDHAAVARALSEATGEHQEPLRLPFQTFRFTDGESGIRFTAAGAGWRCAFVEVRCERDDAAPSRRGGPGAGADEAVVSPDGRTEAFIRNFNVAIRETGSDEVRLVSHDGSEGDGYSLRSIAWSPDSRKLAAYRISPGHERLVHYVASSPDEQLQPTHYTREYTKPGDVLPVRRPVLFHLERGEQVDIDDALFPNAYGMSSLQWREDGRVLTFEYNQRGHQVFRVIEVDGETGEARALISEEPETFFYYRESSASGRKFRYDVDDGREIIWMSEREGWNHLYLYDGESGRVKNRITRGDWVVRHVEHVDEENRQIWFRASGMIPGQDPYFIHYYRINFDGSGLTALTEADGTHTVVFSPEMDYHVVTWSRVDLPPVTELRRASDGAVLAELGRGDHSALLRAGWSPPEVFTATGRDGATEIWGTIIRPSDFDPAKSYPVIEYIYAGPHDNHVPKAFTVLPARSVRQQAELGFIVAQIDGMGTSNRSKAFHDVAWKNLGDAGFPDRILWHEEVGRRYAHYDLSRVGIYGHSAGGQNALGALLFHPDFYHVAVAANGCHDNRMDKIWWNELWMSWPLGPHYAASSNVDNAHLLQGKLLLVVGELDHNVDPSSTYQVADALIKAEKDFDLLVLTGMGHTPGGAYGLRKQLDFFVQHLLEVPPPDWNRRAASAQDGGE